MTERSIRIGVLGAGHLGRIHVQQIREVPEFELVGVFDPDPEKCERLRMEFDAPILGSVNEVIDRAAAVDVVTPTLSHHACASAALQAGRHVFIEKPLTNTIEEGRDLQRSALAVGRKVQVGHVERFNPAFQAALSAFDRPMFIEGHRLAQFNPRGTDVPVILDLMVHDLDLVLHVVGSPVKEVHASGVAVVSDSPDIANARIVFENGCVANLTASRISLKNMRKMRFFQRDAYIAVDMLERSSEIVRMRSVLGEPDPFAVTIDLGKDRGMREISFERPAIEQTNAIREELRAFAASILGDSEPRVTLSDGLAALELAHLILERMGQDAPN
ncbi:MAG: Gfo/Idh/MocA family oxidoreductase [Flavobacteriales bacterium]|nr:Gfo/Idh/MocA family oxidoreductase [Flavobacteriales bacterium]MCB9193854.1 Gfo/Idh/MocA family oxidoreductase [Flavobacteriales bacterium]